LSVSLLVSIVSSGNYLVFWVMACVCIHSLLTCSVCTYSILLFLKFISGVHVLVVGRRL